MNSECMRTFIVILSNCDEWWLCNHLVLVMISFDFENLSVEMMSACSWLQFYTIALGGNLPISTMGVTVVT
jgi:hypothetical protein